MKKKFRKIPKKTYSGEKNSNEIFAKLKQEYFNRSMTTYLEETFYGNDEPREYIIPPMGPRMLKAWNEALEKEFNKQNNIENGKTNRPD